MVLFDRELNHAHRSALRIAIIYAIIAGAWITLSDVLIGLVVRDLDALTQLQMIKGLVFVVVTSCLLFILICRSLKQIHHSELRYRSLFDSAHDAIMVVDQNGNYLDANSTAFSLTGYSRSELLQLNIYDLTPPSERHLVAERLAQLRKSGVQVYRVERHLQTKSGTIVPIEASLSPLVYNDAPAYFSVLRDISQRQHAEKELRQSEERFRILVESAPLGITFARNGINLYANPAYVRLFGYNHAGEILGGSLLEQVAPPCRDEVGERVRRREAGLAVPSRYETLGLRRDGTTFPFEVEVERIPFAEGEASVAFISDITERKRVEAELRFLVQASHALVSSTDYETILQTLAQLAVPFLADWCTVHMVGPDGVLRRITISNAYPEKQPLADELQQHYSSVPEGAQGYAKVIRTGRPELVAHVDEDWLAGTARDERHLEILRKLGIRSTMSVALVARRRILGTLTFVTTDSCRHYTSTDLALAEGLAARAALVIDNARLLHDAQQEIVERKRAEQERAQLLNEVEQQRQRLDAIIANIPGVVWEVREDLDAQEWRIKFVSEYAETLLGYNIQEWLDTPTFWLDIVHPDDQEHVVRDVQTIRNRSSSTPTHSDFRWITKDGDVLWVEAHSALICDSAGKPIGMRGVTMDITERKRAELKLQESETNLRAIFDSANQSIILIDKSYQLLAFNRFAALGAKHVFGKEMAIGQSIMEYVAPEDVASFRTHFQQALEGTRSMIEKPIVGRTSTDWWEFYYHPILLPNGETIGVAFTARSTNDRRQAQAEMHKAQEQLHIVVANAPVGLFALDHQGVFTLAQGKVLDALGVEPDVLVNRSVFEVYEHNERIVQYVEQALSGQTFTGLIYEAGLVLETRWTPVRDINRQITGVIIVATDITEQHQAESRLKESEALQQVILQGTTNLISLKDRERRYLVVNPATAAALNADVDQILGKPDTEFLPSPISQSIQNAEQEVIATGRTVELEITLERDGQPHIFLLSKSPYRDTQGIVQGVICIGRDITERKRSEEALRKSEATNRALINAIPDLMLRLDRNGKYLDFKAAKGFSFPLVADDFLGKHFDDVLSPDLAAQATYSLGQAFSTGQTQVFEYQLQSKHGRREFEARLVVCGEDDALALVRDITERKRMERALQDARDVYLTLVEEAPMLVWRTNQLGHCDFVNRQWTQFTGRRAEQALDTGWRTTIHPDDLNAYDEVYSTARNEQQPFATELRLQRYDGVYRWLDTRATPFYDHLGLMAGYIGTCIDITERKHQEQIKDDFLALASHELKTPLAAVIGYIHLLKRWSVKHNWGDWVDPALQAMNNEGARLDRLINDLLDVSRIQTGRLQMYVRPLNLIELLQQTVKNIQLAEPEHHFQLTLPSLVPIIVQGDMQRLEQVLTNLLTNAAKYSSPYMPIDVALHTTVDEAVITVRDRGIGIPPADLPYVFDRFYQVQRPARESRPGLGLGLYITQEIVRQHGGSVTVDSEEHRGTTFTVRLPVRHDLVWEGTRDDDLSTHAA